MTHLEKMSLWFSKRRNYATLREILQSGEPWAHEFNARKTDLRKQGYVITCTKGSTPSDNVYSVVPPEASGQMRIVP